MAKTFVAALDATKQRSQQRAHSAPRSGKPPGLRTLHGQWEFDLASREGDMSGHAGTAIPLRVAGKALDGIANLFESLLTPKPDKM
jgi:hypothetical protein